MATRRALIGAGFALPSVVRAQERPIQLMVGAGPGGPFDIAARSAAPFLEKHLGGVPIVVVNRAGAGGVVMFNEVAAAAPDGRTVALVGMPGFITALFDGAPRYRVESFAYPGMLTDEPYTLFVGSGTPYRTLADLIAAARAQPETLTIAGTGIGSAPHLTLLQFERVAGVRFTWVPTQGAGQALQLVQGGHVVGSISTVSGTVRLHAQGALRILGLAEPRRWDRAPDLPTLAEQGVEMVAGSARGFAIPAATPEPMIRRWESAIQRTAEDPEFRAQAERDFIVVRHKAREETTRFVQAEAARYGEMWRQTPWK
ncbi:MAG: tripartite tricarboxylate transporter substrate binding protein [Variibacter sp.]|nr:tripartite tricarboxylate transporter substrate binding protein [Variibacter sp.]